MTTWSDTFSGAWAVGTDLKNGDGASYFSITGGKLVENHAGAHRRINITPGGASPFSTGDQFILETLEYITPNAYPIFILRGATNNMAASNETGVYGAVSTTGDYWEIGYFNAGIQNNMANGSRTAESTDFTFEFRCVGQNYYVFVNGAQVGTWADPTLRYNTNREATIGGYSSPIRHLDISGGDYAAAGTKAPPVSRRRHPNARGIITHPRRFR